MLINDYISGCDFAKNLPQVNEVLENAQSDLSLWGDRMVTVKGYKGSISLILLFQKVLYAGMKRCKSDDMTPEERLAGLGIAKKMKVLYEKTNAKLCRSNCFTWVSNLIREYTKDHTLLDFYLTPIKADSEICCLDALFLGFSEEKFKQEFTSILDEESETPNSLGTFGPLHRIIATEKVVQEKLKKKKTD